MTAAERRVAVEVPPAPVDPLASISHVMVLDRCSGGCTVVKGMSNNATMLQSTIPQGSGPFMLDSWVISSKYHYKRFPDYHGRDDEWEQLDYVNMAKIDRMVALGLVALADDESPPKWDATNPRTEPYRKAREAGK